MKQIVAVLTAALLLFALASCGDATVSDEDASLAFVYSFASVFVASFVSAFGEDIEGVTLDTESNELTLDGFNLISLGEQAAESAPTNVPYTSISGSVTNENDTMVADLTLEGGPVETLEFRAGAEVMEAEGAYNITVTANGRQMDLTIDPAEYQ